MISKNTVWLIFLSGMLAGACNKDESTSPSGPITITEADLKAVLKPGNSMSTIDMDDSKISLPTEGANQTWDFRNTKSSEAPYTVNYSAVPSNKGFGTATYAITEEQDAVLGVNFTVTDFYEVSPTGWYELGEIIHKEKLSLGNGIELTSIEDEVLISPKALWSKLPLNYGDTFAAEDSIVEHYTISVPALGLKDAPVRRVLYEEATFKVTGWGKILLPDTGSPIEVLQTRVDSEISVYYFINDKPAPADLLKSLGLTNGLTNEETVYTFMSKKYGTVAEVSFNTFDSGAPKIVEDGDYQLIK